MTRNCVIVVLVIGLTFVSEANAQSGLVIGSRSSHGFTGLSLNFAEILGLAGCGRGAYPSWGGYGNGYGPGYGGYGYGYGRPYGYAQPVYVPVPVPQPVYVAPRPAVVAPPMVPVPSYNNGYYGNGNYGGYGYSTYSYSSRAAYVNPQGFMRARGYTAY